MMQTAEEAIKKYETLGKKIFGKKLPWFSRWDATYDHTVLEKCLKEVIEQSPRFLDEDALFEDESLRCRTFVVSTNLDKHSSKPAIFKSYNIPSSSKNGKLESAFSGTIWQAGRATSAAPTFFKPIVINGDNYSDGATIANNPSHYAIIEATKIWHTSDIDCIVSLGTGPEGEHTLDNATSDILGP